MAFILKNVLKIIPKNLISYLSGKILSVKLPYPLSSLLILIFAKIYQINLNEAEKSLNEYKSIGDFFTRKLKKNARPIQKGIIHPVDACIIEAGKINKNTIIQAKGIYYTIEELIIDTDLAKKFYDGYFFTYYLCPRDYHRIHASISGNISSCIYVPGKLWPVNKMGLQNIAKLYCINERMVIYISQSNDLQKTEMASVLVGALNVGKISLSFDSTIYSNVSKKQNFSWQIKNQTKNKEKNNKKNHEKNHEKNHKKNIDNNYKNKEFYFKKYNNLFKNKGDEIAIFNLGSTVINLFPSSVNFSKEHLSFRGKVCMGESLYFE